MNEQEEFEFRLRLEREKQAPDAPIPKMLPRQRATAAGVAPNSTISGADLLGGAVRGAGSIGATLLAPVDWAARKLNDGKPINVGGYDIAGQDRRASMDEALRSMGADTNSKSFATGKIGTEILGTLGAGPALAVGAKAAGMAPVVTQALQTSGMATGAVPKGFQAKAADMALRSGAGAATGAASALAVNPDEAKGGAIAGALVPGAAAVTGAVGKAAGQMIRGPEQTADMAAAILKARNAGYVIPPSQANPTLANRMMEGFSGKLTTAQNASAKNQEITNSMAAKALGLAPDAKITPDVLNGVRDMAGQRYAAVSSAGTVTPGKAYDSALDAIASPHLQAAAGFPNAKVNPIVDLVDSMRATAFDAGSAVSKIKELRSAADTAYASGNKELGKAAKSISAALEDTLEAHLKQGGNAQALQDFRDARELIAKTYSVEKALNHATGTVDAKNLAGQLQRGKPLSGDLRDVAEFASRFPKAAQPIEKMGSLPQTSPLDWGGALALSSLTHNPLALASAAARPIARATVLSPVVQNRLVQNQTPSSLGQMLNSPRQMIDGMSLSDLYRAGIYRAPSVTAAQ